MTGNGKVAGRATILHHAALHANPPSGSSITPEVPASAGSAAPADRAAKRPSNDVDHLVDVLVGFAALGGCPDATLDVVLQDEDGDGVDGGPQRGGLLEDVDAVLLALDHPGNTADLALHPRQASDESRPILRIRVAEVVGLRAGRRRAVGLGHGRPPSL